MSVKHVTAIIVTYNRKRELLRCINAVAGQTYPVERLIVVDNASTDGTVDELKNENIIKDISYKKERLQEAGFLQDTRILLFPKEKNTGGSGGFYTGMKSADELRDYDYLWMMDDDGYPSSSCLQQLMESAAENDYLMPTSIDIKNHSNLSWPVRKRDGRKTLSYSELCHSWGDKFDYVTPFNGMLLSKECVQKVGYINPDFFLWGDEYDHYHRCVSQGYKPITLLSAIFYHPSQKLPMVPIMFGLLRVPYVDSELRMVCLARNYTYIYLHYHQIYKIPLKFILYTWLFLITRHGDFHGWFLYLLSVRDGFRNDFSRHLSYIK